MRLTPLAGLSLAGILCAAPALAEEGHITFTAPGAYQHRVEVLSRIPLFAPIEGVPDDLGQQAFGYHWLRISPAFDYSDRFVVAGQIDLLRGALYGDTADEVSADDSGRDDLDGYKRIDPRWLYAELRGHEGVLKIGQMGSQWGLGIMANDGTQESLFGDALYGDIVERILYQSSLIAVPALRSGLVVAAGGDVVFRDSIADVDDGDIASQGIAAALLVRPHSQLGLYAAYRDQTNRVQDTLQVLAIDLFARHEGPLPGGGEADTLSMALEAVLVTGRSNFFRTVDVADQDVLQGGAVVRVGVSTARLDANLEFGWASGDSNTLDGTVSRFTMDPDHNVGLILFDEVMAWQTARSATLGADRDVAGRPARGIGLLPTNGGVSGAMYLNPTARLKISPTFDLRGGAVLAQATADVVDPFHQKIGGSPLNYRGGRSDARDLGVELDAGLRWQRPLQERTGRFGGVNLTVGLEGGVLFTGHAFDDANGQGMGPVGMGRARVGLSW